MRSVLLVQHPHFEQHCPTVRNPLSCQNSPRETKSYVVHAGSKETVATYPNSLLFFIPGNSLLERQPMLLSKKHPHCCLLPLLPNRYMKRKFLLIKEKIKRPHLPLPSSPLPAAPHPLAASPVSRCALAGEEAGRAI